MTMKYISATIEKVSTDRTITFIASHEKVDADGEVVLVDGIDLTRFNANPVLLEQHQSQKVAVGTVVRLWKTVINGAKALMGMASFPDRPQSNEAWANVQSGLLSGFSIGFQPLETGPPMLPSQKGVTHVRTSLSEISLVTLPACPTCLIVGKSACGCQVPSPSPSIAQEEADAVLIVEDARIPLAAKRIGREAGRLAHQAVQRSMDSPFVLEIEDTFDVDPAVVKAGVKAACVAWIAATATAAAREAINYARGRVT